ncbi:hypothetical protein DASC09_045090 [Saccharomycopsis crataegensis]|uniref:Ankyrin n=1 Tax=Saccharomycopsis crataegensis TaxID=43959 RepID=A0AAV5QRV5_9ASCO|nr:hypothetical protein DASC09_045090 [Saccharomycopsis crataegensis]
MSDLDNGDGASYKEQLLDASRRNNDDLLATIFEEIGDPEKIAELINTAKDPLGNSSLHLATKYGNYSALDLILDQEGVEVDPQNRLDGDTPLHIAVRYSHDDPEYGKFLAEVLTDVGADPRIKNKHGEKPVDLVRGEDPEHEELRDILEQAQYAAMVSKDADVIDGDVVQNMNNLTLADGEDGSGSESPSDSDSEESSAQPSLPSSIPPPPPPK